MDGVSFGRFCLFARAVFPFSGFYLLSYNDASFCPHMDTASPESGSAW